MRQYHFLTSCLQSAVINRGTNESSRYQYIGFNIEVNFEKNDRFYIVFSSIIQNAWLPSAHIISTGLSRRQAATLLFSSFSKYYIISCYLFQFTWEHLVLLIKSIAFRQNFYFLFCTKYNTVSNIQTS